MKTLAPLSPPSPLRPLAMFLTGLFILSHPAFAQSNNDDLNRTDAAEESRDIDTGNPATAPAGLPWGSFQLYPSITLSHGLDSNLYGEARNETRGWVTTLTPAVEARSQWTRHGLELSAGADLMRYPAHGAENTDDYWLKAAGHLDLSDSSRLFGQAYARRDHEERGSPESTSGETPTVYDTRGAVVGLNQRFGDLTVRLGLVRETLDFDTPAGIVGTNDDRDRTLDSFGLRLSYPVATGLSVFALAGHGDHTHHGPLQPIPQRNHPGRRVGLFHQQPVGQGRACPRRALAGDRLAGLQPQRLPGNRADQPQHAWRPGGALLPR